MDSQDKPEDGDKLNKIKLRKKKRSTAKGQFHRVFNRFKEQTKTENGEVLQEILKDMEHAYEKLEGEHSAYLNILDSDDETEGDIINTANSDMDKNYSQLCDARADLVMINRKNKEDKSKVNTTKEHPNTVKVKRLEAPTFSGNVREYPSFRNDYSKLMTPDPFALKQCLSGEALKTVQGVDDNFTAMFKRLDMKYGREERIAESVLYELKSLKKVSDGDNKGFIQTIDIIELCWLDLCKMKMEREMDTATMMSQIEVLLPTIQKREWAIRKQRDRSLKFKDFMNFLLEEKNAMEYIESDLREGATSIKSAAHVVQVGEDQSSIQVLLKENQVIMKQMVNGLAQVTEAVQRRRPNQDTDGKFDRQNQNKALNQKKCWYHETDRHDIGQCYAFFNLDEQSKVQLLRKNGCCFSCLKTGHLSRDCSRRNPCDIINEDHTKCGKYHHPALHGIPVSALAFHNSMDIVNDDRGREDVILMVSNVTCNGIQVATLWDPGSNISLITRELAGKLNLKGRNVTLSVTKVGNSTDSIQSKEFILPLSDAHGETWQIKVYGMDEITADVSKVNVQNVVNLFRGIKTSDIVRPTGKIELLIGTDCCALLPTKIDQIGNLQLMKNQFGYCLRGSHTMLQSYENVNNNAVRINHASGIIHNINDMQIENLPLKESIDKFYEIESLGISCTPKCGNCKCGKCPIGNNNYTIQDERELIMIRNGLNYDSESQKWEASYPWKRSPSELPNNVNSAKAKLLSTEKRLHKMGKEYSESYQNQIEDMVKRNVARKLTEKEIQQYEGPVHYIHHHEVLKPESKSTPIRIVFNSSASYMGHVLNEYWAKGPNVINDLLGVLLRFRQERVATAGDISKMYNSVNLSLLDQHTHRFVWRDMDSSKLPDHYVLQTVTFGDKPSGAIATIALQMTADMCSHTYPDTAQMINKNSYVDDILVSKETMKEAKNLIQNCDNILHKGGFAIKHWIVSGDSNDEMEGLNVVRTDEEKILGMIWQPMSDTFTLKIKLNFSPKRKGVRTGFNLNAQQIDDIPQNLTRRTVLSQVSSIYDPLGLVTPYILSAKLLMRSMCTKSDIGWDTPLDEQLTTTWIEFFRGLFELENIKVPRRLKPEFTIGSPTLVIFSDASQVAYGACAYVRWQTGNNYETRLLFSKNRIAPTKQLSIPRLELCAAILAARMRQKIIQEMDWEFVKVIHITDSMIVRAQIQKESYGFGTFVATRVAEIQSITDPTDWYWIQGNLNPADLVTRPTQPDILDENSVWQRGPEFMRESIDCWPTRQDSTIESKQLPDVVSVTLCIDKRHVKIAPTLIDIDISRFSRLEKLLRVTALVLSIIKKNTFRGTFHTLNTKSIKQAEHMWVKEAQGEITETFMTLFQRLGPYKRQDGIIVVGQRMADWIKESWNQTEFVLIPSKHPLANLIVQSVHNEDHGGIDSTLAKIRSRFWIPGVRRTIKQIKEKCVTCRKRNKTTLTQQMGKLPSYRLNPSPPFYYCAVDLFGPYTIRDTVKRRTFGKAYGVIFNCLTSRGVYVDLVEGYDKNSFLIALRRFVSIRGYPRMMISDAGTQLVAAGKELKQVVHTWDWDDIKTFGTSKGMQWNIIKSADAPWENGCSEALIKSVKKCLDVAIGDSVMTFSELQTVLFETANVLNERPIGTKNCDPNEGTYLCPNDLLLGRASIRVPNGHYNQDCNPRNRHAFIQNVVNSFWRKWIRDYFHTLIIRQKWHTSYRNLKKGDLVLVQDSNALRGKWKLGQVDEAIPSLDGNVRDVTVRYKNIGGSGTDYQNVTDTKIRRSVHRLVLLLPVEEQTNVTV